MGMCPPGAMEMGAGQGPMKWMVPSFSTSRAGSLRALNHPTASSPWTMAAVAAVLASTQFAASTVTVRQRLRLGWLVLGSMM